MAPIRYPAARNPDGKAPKWIPKKIEICDGGRTKFGEIDPKNLPEGDVFGETVSADSGDPVASEAGRIEVGTFDLSEMIKAQRKKLGNGLQADLIDSALISLFQ